MRRERSAPCKALPFPFAWQSLGGRGPLLRPDTPGRPGALVTPPLHAPPLPSAEEELEELKEEFQKRLGAADRTVVELKVGGRSCEDDSRSLPAAGPGA